jgi:N-acetylneuraminate synthase
MPRNGTIDMSNHTLIIAEAGVNHNGDIGMAMKLIEVAAEAGADVVKFQSFKSALIASSVAPKASYQQQATGSTESQLEMVARLELSDVDHELLMRHAAKCGITFLSTPFDLPSIALLKQLGITWGKVPSGEMTNKPYLEAMARSFPELIVSTGMCDMEEVEAALTVLLEHGAHSDRITLLHCNTEYPTPYQDVNLRAMGTLADHFGTRIGYSDHTIGIEVPIAAVALGASVIEKHFPLDRGLPGPDHKASLEPNELKAMVTAIRNIEIALGNGLKSRSPSEAPNVVIARKSIHLASPVEPGTTIAQDMLVMLRPGDGISPMHIDEVLGKRATRALPAGHKLNWSDVA